MGQRGVLCERKGRYEYLSRILTAKLESTSGFHVVDVLAKILILLNKFSRVNLEALEQRPANRKTRMTQRGLFLFFTVDPPETPVNRKDGKE